VDVVAEEVSDDELEVSLLGSYNSDAMHIWTLYLRTRAGDRNRPHGSRLRSSPRCATAETLDVA
jgi:hypothetical protein